MQNPIVYGGHFKIRSWLHFYYSHCTFHFTRVTGRLTWKYAIANILASKWEWWWAVGRLWPSDDDDDRTFFIDGIWRAVTPPAVDLAVAPEVNFASLLAPEMTTIVVATIVVATIVVATFVRIFRKFCHLRIRALLAVLGDRGQRRAEVRIPPLTKVATLLWHQHQLHSQQHHHHHHKYQHQQILQHHHHYLINDKCLTKIAALLWHHHYHHSRPHTQHHTNITNILTIIIFKSLVKRPDPLWKWVRVSPLPLFTKLCNEIISISQYQENLRFHLQAQEAHLVTPEIWIAAFFTSVRAQFPVRGKAPCWQEVIVDSIWDQ